VADASAPSLPPLLLLLLSLLPEFAALLLPLALAAALELAVGRFAS